RSASSSAERWKKRLSRTTKSFPAPCILVNGITRAGMADRERVAGGRKIGESGADGKRERAEASVPSPPLLTPRAGASPDLAHSALPAHAHPSPPPRFAANTPTLDGVAPLPPFGFNDSYLRKIEAAFADTRITARGDRVMLRGDED